MTFLPRLRSGKSAAWASRLRDLGPAPELSGVHPWLNTPDGELLTIAGLLGRVVLIEFWTFACVNCARTLPFLRRMHLRYQPQLTVIGVHTPELPLERPARDVERAVRERALTFPVGLDNDYAAWGVFGNQYWPSLYLVDAEGRIRYTHVGEGRDRRTDTAISLLLTHAREET